MKPEFNKVISIEFAAEIANKELTISFGSGKVDVRICDEVARYIIPSI